VWFLYFTHGVHANFVTATSREGAPLMLQPPQHKTNSCTQHGLLQWQLLVRAADARVLGHHLPITPHHPFAGQQALHSHRPASMDAAGADAHFSTQPKPAHMTATAAGQTNSGLVGHLVCG